MMVLFSAKAEWDGFLRGFLMWATAGQEHILCVVPVALFVRWLGKPDPTVAEITAQFRQQRPDLEKVFSRMIEAGNTTLWPDAPAGKPTRCALLTLAEFTAFVRDRGARREGSDRPND